MFGAISEITRLNFSFNEFISGMSSIDSMLFWKNETPSISSICNISIAKILEFGSLDFK